jgi:hypothetical protein
MFTIKNSRENYIMGTQRLIDKIIINNIDADILIFAPDIEQPSTEIINDHTINIINSYPKTNVWGVCKSHHEEPYQFKSFGIQQAREMGYNKISWLEFL